MNNELLDKILTDENYGKGLVNLPEGTVVPEGKVIYFSFNDERGGAGMMQSTIVYRIKRELSRSEDNKFYYSHYLMNEGKETAERYLVPEETMNVFNRLVRNFSLAGCNALKHDYLPGLMSPINTERPIYNMKLSLENDNGEITEIPISSFDISSNGYGDVLEALFAFLESIRTEENIVPLKTKASEEVQAPATSGPWKCECGNINTGKFCINCGHPRN